MSPAFDRYFVVNRWPGKNGPRYYIHELDDHVEATQLAYYMASEILRLTSRLDEDFFVFVGSKSALGRAFPAASHLDKPIDDMPQSASQ